MAQRDHTGRTVAIVGGVALVAWLLLTDFRIRRKMTVDRWARKRPQPVVRPDGAG